MGKGLTTSDFHAAAALLGVDVPTVMAVAEVESAGAGFLPDGQVKILFEAHIFSRLTRGAYNRSHPEISSAGWDRTLYKGGAQEHTRLQAAVALDRNAALQSASWGMFQIMGFNYARCGFANVQEFVNAMVRSEGEHLQAFCRFVRSMRLDDELQRRDWAAFAAGYNGASFAANRYDTRLAQAYTRFNNASIGG